MVDLSLSLRLRRPQGSRDFDPIILSHKRTLTPDSKLSACKQSRRDPFYFYTFCVSVCEQRERGRNDGGTVKRKTCERMSERTLFIIQALIHCPRSEFHYVMSTQTGDGCDWQADSGIIDTTLTCDCWWIGRICIVYFNAWSPGGAVHGPESRVELLRCSCF